MSKQNITEIDAFVTDERMKKMSNGMKKGLSISEKTNLLRSGGKITKYGTGMKNLPLPQDKKIPKKSKMKPL